MARTGLNFTWKMFTEMRVRCEVRGRLECLFISIRALKIKRQVLLKAVLCDFSPFSNYIV